MRSKIMKKAYIQYIGVTDHGADKVRMARPIMIFIKSLTYKKLRVNNKYRFHYHALPSSLFVRMTLRSGD